MKTIAVLCLLFIASCLFYLASVKYSSSDGNLRADEIYFSSWAVEIFDGNLNADEIKFNSWAVHTKLYD